MYRAHEIQQAQHEYAIKNSCICQCLHCSGERLDLQQKADYEKAYKLASAYYSLPSWS